MQAKACALTAMTEIKGKSIPPYPMHRSFRVVYTLSNQVSKFTGQCGPFTASFDLDQRIPLSSRARQRAYSPNEPHRTRSFPSADSFPYIPTRLDPYRIRSRRPFRERVGSQRPLPQFSSHTRTLRFILIACLRRVFPFCAYPVCCDRTTWFREPPECRFPFHTGLERLVDWSMRDEILADAYYCLWYC
jgi:hypothetical protein